MTSLLISNNILKEDHSDLIFKVNIIKARNLSREDEASVPSPYVHVQLGGIKQRTETIKKSSNPDWLCSFEFNITQILQNKKTKRLLEKSGLSLTVYSKDRFSSIFLGQAYWNLDQLFESSQPLYFEQTEKKWYPLIRTNYRKKHRLRRMHQDVDYHSSTATSDISEHRQPGIYVQYGLFYKSQQIAPESLKDDWQFILDQLNSTQAEVGELNVVNRQPSIGSLGKDSSLEANKKAKGTKFKQEYAEFFSDVTGIVFLEIENAKYLPPEKNVTRTSFDMDPFVIVSYGTSTFRTRAIRHNLNPVWNEKLFFHVKNSREDYKLKFAIYDKDKFSNNDFVASQEISLKDITHPTSIDPNNFIENDMDRYTIELDLSKSNKWKERPTLTFRAKFVPYVDIRKMFWITLAKTCDADNSNSMNRLEIQTMLETLGSTITESTLDQFWKENHKEPDQDLTMDELVESLELFLINKTNEKTTRNPFFHLNDTHDYADGSDITPSDSECTSDTEILDTDSSNIESLISTSSNDDHDLEALAEAEGVQYMDPSVTDNENHNEPTTHPIQEKVIRLSECPVCHKPNLHKRGQLDIVTHVAICAANDWTTVDRFLINNYGSEAQAQRRWFTKLVSQVGYGKYSIGKNNANIIVQDRSTGQLIDERMSVYIRLGMRLLYRGIKSSVQLKTAKRMLANMSIKQGRRFDDPLSVKEIRPFIKFHKLEMNEVLEPIENFKSFNEFFYRKLKPGSRPCDSPDDKRVAVSSADCRMMAFPTIDEATKIWIKGTEFSLSKLLDDPEEAKVYQGGSLAIFRLAPQDYHRFHSPVDGKITKIHSVQGQYYTVNPMAIRTTLDVYGDNRRDIVHMQTDVFGKVAIVCVGAMMVGSIVLSAGEGDYLARTDELGYFAFGGSTLVVLFEKNTIKFDEDLQENAKNSLETLVRVGNHIGSFF